MRYMAVKTRIHSRSSTTLRDAIGSHPQREHVYPLATQGTICCKCRKGKHGLQCNMLACGCECHARER